jgi:sugar phosphate isomerase/epimerase
MNRRRFLRSAVLASLAAPLARAEAPRKEAVLNLGSQEGRLPGASLKEKVANLAAWGGVGLELGGNPKGRIQEIRDAVAGTNVKVSALCWGAHKGDLVSLDMEKRKKGIEDLKDALTTAGELQSTGVIFVPCFNKESELAPAELDRILFDILPDIAAHAVKAGSRVLLEPLNKGETFYINRIEQAAAICRRIDSPGLGLMGDFYHMSKEESDQEQAFLTGAPWLWHVHLATGKSRILPAQEDHSYVEGMRGLRKLGYPYYCSLECGCRKGTDPMVEIPKAFAFLREQWKLAGA